MSKLKELEDFSMYDGHIPCVLCKGESCRTLMGNHWKCSVCAHLFNADGAELKLPVPCLCDSCREKAEKTEEPAVAEENGIKKILKRVKKSLKSKKKAK